MNTQPIPVPRGTATLICQTNGELYVSSGRTVSFTQSDKPVDTSAPVMFELKRGERHPIWDLPNGVKIYAWANTVDSIVSFSPRGPQA